MTLHDSVWLFQALHAAGLAVWLLIAVINNVQAFAGSMHAVGLSMSMAALQEAPAIDTPLLKRAMGSTTRHRMALALVLVLQIAAAGAGLVGSYEMIFAGGLTAARPWLNLALTSFTAFILAMHLGGMWFAYWIRQEGLQLTHISLLLWTLAAFILFNTSWA
ncbi:MAG: DUF2165 family protein [Comamonadaceae bacterium]|nr:MAG: DUF2165 family protein [Comamonadaceae bacterium]